MTNFEDFNLIVNNLVVYFTGSYAILAGLMGISFLLILISRGLDLRYATLLTLPLLGFFAAIGWFGSISWVVNLVLILVAFFYGFAVLKLTT